MKKFLIKHLAIALALSFATADLRATIHDIDVGSFFFNPQKTVVSPGDSVRWTRVSGIHTTSSVAPSAKVWDSGSLSLLLGQQFMVQFTAGDGPGPFPYVCNFHPFSMKDTIFMSIPAEPIRFAFVLDGIQTNPCGTAGNSERGFGLATLSPDSSELSIFVVHDVASPVGGHVHLGAPCVSGGIQFSFASSASPISETWALSASDVTNLLNGDLYINIHRSFALDDEIRGQIVQEKIRFIYNLDEAQANAGGGTGSFASGFGVSVLSADAKELTTSVTHDVSGITDGHIHLGAPGVSGTIQQSFSSASSPISDVWMLDTTDIKNLISGDLYVNLHSGAFGAGEIRGQIIRDKACFAFPLTEAEADTGNGTGSSATGFGVCVLNSDQSELSIHVEHDVVNVSDGHIHLGAPGVGGAIQFAFSSFTSPIDQTWTLTNADVDNLLAGDLYVNIHSTAFPLGEIRGQIDQGAVAVNFSLDEAQADTCNGTGSLATGTATATLKAEAKQLTISITHDVSGIQNSHLHLGFPCVGGPIQFSFASSVSPISEIWYLDTGSVADFLRGELYANLHSTSFSAGEIRGQLVNDPSCCAKRGNINGSGDQVIDISDLTYLVAFMFGGGAPPPCMEEGNTNGSVDGLIDISDLTYLVAFMFGGGPPPPGC